MQPVGEDCVANSDDNPQTTLDEYERKRRRGKTPELFDEGSEGGEHDVRRPRATTPDASYYDFRLERNGTASWAVPSGLPLEPGDRHLAVHVEDHPLEYADFEGRDPGGEYGAGTVEIQDRGTYELSEEKRNGGLTVLPARRTPQRSSTPCRPSSTATPRTGSSCARGRAAIGGERSGYKPMLATLGQEATLRARMGIRGQVGRLPRDRDGGGGETTLTSRNEKDLTERFPAARRATREARQRSGRGARREVWALDEEGRSRFSPLQQGRKRRPVRRSICSRSTRPGRRAAAGRTAPAPRGAGRPEQAEHRRSPAVRGRPGLLEAARSTGSRGRDRQAAGLALRARPAHEPVAQDQDAPGRRSS